MSRRPEVKTPEQLRQMRAAGLVVARALQAVSAAVRPGATAAELDALAEQVIRAEGAVPSFFGVPGGDAPDYAWSTCISVDHQVVHGVPRASTVLRAGSLVSIDCGAVLAGWHGDAAITVAVGGEAAVAPELLELSRVTEAALWAGLAAARPGARLDAVGSAVEAAVRPHGFGIVDGYAGHGIGSAMHMAPEVANVGGARGGRLRLVPGHALAVEPMLTLGDPEVEELADGWTVATADGSAAAHWEHTVAITPSGPWVLTALDGGRARLGDLVSDEALADAVA